PEQAWRSQGLHQLRSSGRDVGALPREVGTGRAGGLDIEIWHPSHLPDALTTCAVLVSSKLLASAPPRCGGSTARRSPSGAASDRREQKRDVFMRDSDG